MSNPTKENNPAQRITISAASGPGALVENAWQDVGASFERFCLTAVIATLSGMLEEDAVRLCGSRYGRAVGKEGHRWGKTRGKVGFHGGKVEIERPRVRACTGGELALPSWTAAQSEDLLGKWVVNLMLINVSTRRFGRAVRLPESDVPAPKGESVSKSAVSRRFVALSATRMKEWMSSDLSGLDLLIIQIDGMHMDDDLMLVGAVGIDGVEEKYPLGAIEGATENAAVVQALLGFFYAPVDNLACRRREALAADFLLKNGNAAGRVALVALVDGIDDVEVRPRPAVAAGVAQVAACIVTELLAVRRVVALGSGFAGQKHREQNQYGQSCHGWERPLQ